MKYLQIRKENDLKEIRYFLLTKLKELNFIDEPVIKSYATMIIKMYELNYYDEYEHILEEFEEKALIEIIEFFIGAIDYKGSSNINSNTRNTIKIIESICVEKQYRSLAESLLELEEMLL